MDDELCRSIITLLKNYDSMNDGKVDPNKSSKHNTTIENLITNLKTWAKSNKDYLSSSTGIVRYKSCTLNFVFQCSGLTFVIKVNKSKNELFKEYVLEILNKIKEDKQWREECSEQLSMNSEYKWRVIYVERKVEKKLDNKDVVTIYNKDLRNIDGLNDFIKLVEKNHAKIHGPSVDDDELKGLNKDHEFGKHHSPGEIEAGKRLKDCLERMDLTLVDQDMEFDGLVNKIHYIFKYEKMILMINYGLSSAATNRRSRRFPLLQVKDSEDLQEKLLNRLKDKGVSIDKNEQFYAMYADLRDTRYLPVNPTLKHVFIIYNEDWEGRDKKTFLDIVQEKDNDVRKYMNDRESS